MNIFPIDVSSLELILNHKFKDIKLLTLALTHPSFSARNYESLEFLGDSILNFTITKIIIEKFGLNKDEGKLSKIKSYLVSREVLTLISRELDLTKYVLMSYGEQSTGGLQKDKIAENCLEAVIGALYLDSDIHNIYKFIFKHWNKYFLNLDKIQFDPKTKLQEISYKLYKSTPTYSLLDMQQNKLAHSFKVQLTLEDLSTIGMGTNKKEAEKNAAKLMLNDLNSIKSK